MKCNAEVVGTVIHFNSLFGSYQTEVVKYNPVEMDLHYSGEIFEGTQKWTVKVFNHQTKQEKKLNNSYYFCLLFDVELYFLKNSHMPMRLAIYVTR